MNLCRFIVLSIFIGFSFPDISHAATSDDADDSFCENLPGTLDGRRVVCADVAALDQMLVYNRFGSYNPFGMMFALRRDLVPAETVPTALTAADCAADLGTTKDLDDLDAGEVRLRDCKRPRPLVLRANEGDLLAVQVSNLLRPHQPGHSQTFCRSGDLGGAFVDDVRAAVSEGDATQVAHQEVACLAQTAGQMGSPAEPGDTDWPLTRGMTFAVQGLVAVVPDDVDDAADDLDVCRGLRAIPPDASVSCFYEVDREGPYFFASNAAPSGGEGDGGSITHGLFGAVVAEPAGSIWYRSQVSRAAFDTAWSPVDRKIDRRLATGDHRRSGQVDYAATTADGVPVLAMLRTAGDGAAEIVHTDLNAIVHDVAEGLAFREFGVFFHDELKSFYTRNFEDLSSYDQFAGVRDGFAINYGASGMGTLLLANRKGIGPSKDCVECLYEEFFLSSWANGDPALLERYADDPSNVHHSYLNDAIRFRNFHAGPKETHVFHLHAHQWFAGNDGNRGAYLDSQTVAPQQGFTYNIYNGGLDKAGDGAAMTPWAEAGEGSGNRNRTVGDSIFHCHLYPHFAQGMWELWRVHDVLEDGTRLLPDGQSHAGLSIEADTGAPRLGSVDPDTGAWIAAAEGTPVPAIVPLPDTAPPILPSYADPDSADPYLAADGKAALPGYPFFIAGQAGHRPPQAPLDIARADEDHRVEGRTVIAEGAPLDAGLPRHVVTGGTRTFGVEKAGIPDPANEAQLSQLVARMLALGDMSASFDTLEIAELDHGGTLLERAAMGFHHDGTRYEEGLSATPGPQVDARRPDGVAAPFDPASGGYPTGTAGSARVFAVNGAPPKPGAPFADPCGAPTGIDTLGRLIGDPLLAFGGVAGPPLRTDPQVRGFRRYEASAVQLDLITNRAGWHDPQARINVLTENSDPYKDNVTGLAEPISPFVSAREEPFFFRAFSNECIEFRHTNELPKELELDDFQVKTPTDTIGQHIHLVKFDVTASDGSGNGFNYEDGTFAPDEVAVRVCKGIDPSDPRCSMPEYEEHRIWTLKRSDHPELFQTTTQRWFADPILSDQGYPEGEQADRTMRTVFSHDHFGPSSIQQHGFYTALVIEPRESRVCLPDGSNCESFVDDLSLADDNRLMVGTHRALINDAGIVATDALPPGRRWPGPDALHPNTREYALAVADFALLYDPRDVDADAEAAIGSGSPRGMAKLACEARHWRGAPPSAGAETCGSEIASDAEGFFDAAPIPAWNAGGRVGDAPGHVGDLAAFMDAGDADAMTMALQSYRQRAALSDGGRLAKPVAPPQRPESISVDHHDPYLVNYRGEPIPLRIGTKDTDPDGTSGDCELATMPVPGSGHDPQADVTLIRDAADCSVSVQRPGDAGDMANVFLSTIHRDPATPILETYSGERTLVRMIQGAQEVQHMFGIEGFAWKRNLDQAFPQASPPIGAPASEETARQACNALAALQDGYPAFYRAYFDGRLGDVYTDPLTGATTEAPAAVKDFFAAFDAATARCINAEGYATAQEIGISEHFEIAGAFRKSVSVGTLRVEGETMIAPEAVPDPDRRRASTDYLWSYGTQDALWNGAWGMLRVYRDLDSPDLTRCMGPRDATFDQCNSAATVRIGARIKPLRDLASPDTTAADARLPESFPETQIAACPADAPRVRAAVAAIEARKIWGPMGMRYGRDTYDPDGLLLAELDPDLIDDLLVNAQEADDRMALEEAVRVAVSDAAVEPYVLSVRAGDCVELTVVNLLEPADGAAGLRDGIGDARMPPITGLNTDPAVGVASGAAAIRTLAADPAARRHNDVTPSARLSLRFPLPTLNDTNDMALPFGWNATGGLAPMQTQLLPDHIAQQAATDGFVRRVATAERLNFYAGKASFTEPFDALLRAVHRRFRSQLDPDLLGAIGQTQVRVLPYFPRDDEAFEVLGVQVALFDRSANRVALSGMTDEMRADLASAWDAAARDVVGARAHWMPYAFGAMPIKSFGDVIGHGSHGLIGAIMVLPQDWTFEDGTAPGESYTVRPGTARAGWGQSGTQPPIGGEGDPTRLRAFTLFYQDGLNLHDRRSQLSWAYDKDGVLSPVPDVDGLRQRPMPECIVCDDSYDLGDRGISYHSAPFFARLRDAGPGGGHALPWVPLEADTDLNAALFPQDFFLLQPGEAAAGAMAGTGPAKAETSLPVLRAEEGEEIIVSVVQPSGRARQHAVVTIAQDYDDLFPGFGFPHAALMAPGKAVNAPLALPARAGCYLMHDGPTHLRGGGIWWLLDVVAEGQADDPSVSNCHAAREE